MTVYQRKQTMQEERLKKSEVDFKTLYVIIIANNAVFDTVTWLIDLISRPQMEGGTELLVRTTYTHTEGIIIEIGATVVRFLEAAEALEITKLDKKGNMREFVFSDLDQFLKPGLDMNNLLSTSEKQHIIFEEIMGIRAMEKKTLIGYSNILLYPGQSIVQVCKNNGIIECMFPLHEHSELNALKTKWSLKYIPLDDIRNYFGESVAFYFAFLSYYTCALIPPAIIGILQILISFDISRCYVYFAVCKMIWLTIFLEFWKRRSSELSFLWGTLKLVNLPKLHPTFRGRCMEIDPVTKHHIPSYPANRRHFKVYCISLPVVMLCLVFAVLVMIAYFKIEKLIIATYDDGTFEGWIISQLPGILYAIIVYLMNVAYAHFATFLTEMENHKLQESFENHRIVKLLLFEFVNNFIAMGYIAFYEKDLSMLKKQICTMMIVQQIFNQFQEAFLPFLLQLYRKNFVTKSMKSVSPRIKNILEQREMCVYDGTYDDYAELFIQYGNVFLFSSVFPLAAALAIINNVIELWTDGFKLCRAYQRPHARPVKGIGVWQLAFEVLSLLAVMTNCALISMSPGVRSYAPDMSLSSWLLVAVAIEHIIIAVKMVMSYLISDVPKWVKVAIQKNQYEALQALKQERREKTQVMLHSLNINYDKLE